MISYSLIVGESLVLQAPTGSGKSAILASLPLLANGSVNHSAWSAWEVPLAFLFCFPLESLRDEYLPVLRRVAATIDRCEVLATAQGMVIERLHLGVH